MQSPKEIMVYIYYYVDNKYSINFLRFTYYQTIITKSMNHTWSQLPPYFRNN